MLKLYTARNSICTQKALITLYEKGLEWEQVTIDLFKNEQYSEEYLKLNPKGVVPTLVHDGAVINESTLICEYLDEAFPEPRLTPKHPAERARMRLWSKFIDEGIFESTREISFSAMFRERMKNMTADQREGRFRNVGNPEKRARLISTYEDGVESPYVFYGIAHFEKMFGAMDEALAGGADWLVANEFSLGDINIIPFAARLEYLDLLDVWIAGRPAIQRWWARAKARPSVVESIANRLTPIDAGAMRTFGSDIKSRIGERRAAYIAAFG